MDGRSNAVVGAVFFFGGIAITAITYAAAEGGGTYVLAWGAIVFGFIQMIRGLSQMSDERHEDPEPFYEAQPAGPGQPARLVDGGISHDDYPAQAVRDGLEGRVVIGFEVDQQGGVQNAFVAESSGHGVLDEAACAVIGQRFKFEPARDQTGNPVVEHRRQTVAWTLD
jgi:TonB family protein